MSSSIFSFMHPFLDKIGIDSQRLQFALITAVASILALFTAQAMGLMHPQWAAMTVWAAAQPWRENLLEKSWWRFAGTVSGVMVGVILIVLGTHHHIWLVLGLSLWVALCSAIAQLQKNLVMYGTGLAGYSAAMVSMLSLPNPNKIGPMAWDRLSTILVGVLTAIVVCYFFTPKRNTEASTTLAKQVQTLFYQVLYQTFTLQKNASTALNKLWLKMALLDDLYTSQSIGTPKNRHDSKQNRALLWLRCQILLSVQTTSMPLPLLTFNPEKPDDNQWQILLHQAQNSPWYTLLVQLFQLEQKQNTSIAKEHNLHVHRDLFAAKQTFIRSFVSLASLGLLWLITQWSFLPYLILGLSVMLSLFASFDNPAIFMRNVIKGQALGAMAALICMWTLWPYAQSSWHMVWMMVPFIITCILVFAYRPLVLMSFDYIMVLLILLQPSYPMHITLSQSISNALAIVAGPVIALLAYRYIYPIAPSKRYRHILHMVQNSSIQQPHEKAQFIHRLLQAILLTQKDSSIQHDTLSFFHWQWKRKI